MNIIYRIKGFRKIYLYFENYLFNFLYRSKLNAKIKIFGFPIIHVDRNAQVKIGQNVVFISSSIFSEPGVNHPVVIRLLSENAKLTIGDNVGISGGGICVQEEVVIGNQVLLGANAFITDTDFHPINPENRRSSREDVGTAKVVIEDNVFIGMDSIVLKGVTIGKNSIVGAGSVVTKSIPPNQIWGGNPAKFIKEI